MTLPLPLRSKKKRLSLFGALMRLLRVVRDKQAFASELQAIQLERRDLRQRVKRMREFRKLMKERDKLRWYPVLKTKMDYAAEARANPPFLRLWGINKWAAWHMGENSRYLNRHYKRMCDYIATKDFWRKAGSWVVFPIFTAFFPTAGFFYFSADTKSSVIAWWGLTYVNTGVVGVFMLIFAILGGITLFKLRMWNLSHMSAFIFETNAGLEDDDPIADLIGKYALMGGDEDSDDEDSDDDEDTLASARLEDKSWVITGLLTTSVPRLAYIDKEELGDYYPGPSGRSGFLNASTHLALPRGQYIYELNDPKMVYDLRPKMHSLQRIVASETYNYMKLWAEIGKDEADLGRNKLLKALEEYWLAILLVIGGVFCIYLAMDTGNWSMQAVNAMQQGG